jgi:ABC-2 type transport system permease protein
MSKFTTIVIKEMKDLLRDPKIIIGMIVVPLIMFPAMGAMFRTGVESAGGQIAVGVIDYDNGEFSEVVGAILQNDPAIKLIEVSSQDIKEAIRETGSENVQVLIAIPEGFTESIQAKTGTRIRVYAIVKGVGMGEVITATRIDMIVNGINKQLAAAVIKSQMPDVDPNNVLDPITVDGYTVLKGEIVDIHPAYIANLISSQSFIVPVVLMVMILFVAQMAATSMATEKENKTLETLLTLPVSRLSILAGKMGGTAAVSLIAAVAYIFGFNSYMSALQVPVQVSVTLKDIGFSITPVGYLLLGLSIFMAILAALSIAMILAVFTQDVRSAQSLVSFTIMPLVFPAMILMFADLNSLPAVLKYVLLVLPFSHPTIAAKSLILRNYGIVVGGIAYLAVFTLMVLFTAARLFSTERVITAKIKFRRKRAKSA